MTLFPDDRPTLHVTNWSSKKLHGPGRKLTIMANPRKWEHGDGLVPSCTPTRPALLLLKVGSMTWLEFHEHILRRVLGQKHKPGELWAIVSGDTRPVEDGDTLCCACSREDAEAGHCHRVFVAEALAQAGWRIVLDGKEVRP